MLVPSPVPFVEDFNYQEVERQMGNSGSCCAMGLSSVLTLFSFFTAGAGAAVGSSALGSQP